MRKIAVMNQKGGVGKTTTVVTIAKGLAKNGKSVLIVDLDAQGNLASCLKVEKPKKDAFHLFTEKIPVNECITKVSKNLDLIYSDEKLAKAEVILAGEQSRETLLKRKLGEMGHYDYIILDCPPSLGLLNQNALLYAEEAVIPASTDFLGYEALCKMVDIVNTMNEVFKHNLKITQVVPTMYTKRSRSCNEFLKKMKSRFGDIVTNPVRYNSKIQEAPIKGKAVTEFAKSSIGAKDYEGVIISILHGEIEDVDLVDDREEDPRKRRDEPKLEEPILN